MPDNSEATQVSRTRASPRLLTGRLARFRLLTGLDQFEDVNDSKALTEPDSSATPDDKRASQEYKLVVQHLRQSIRVHQLRSTRLLIVFTLASSAALVWLWFLSKAGLDEIKRAPDRNHIYAVTVYLLVRGIAYGGIIAGVVFGIYRLARSALDQATRFDKRLIALHFIRFAIGGKVPDKEILPLALHALQTWSSTVDSAYTDHSDSGKPRFDTLRLNGSDKEVEIKMAQNS